MFQIWKYNTTDINLISPSLDLIYHESIFVLDSPFFNMETWIVNPVNPVNPLKHFNCDNIACIISEFPEY